MVRNSLPCFFKAQELCLLLGFHLPERSLLEPQLCTLLILPYHGQCPLLDCLEFSGLPSVSPSLPLPQVCPASSLFFAIIISLGPSGFTGDHRSCNTVKVSLATAWCGEQGEKMVVQGTRAESQTWG